LLSVMTERLAGLIAAAFDEVVAASPDGPERTARACIRCQFEDVVFADERADRAAAVFLSPRSTTTPGCSTPYAACSRSTARG
jgi:hypothetical protein